MKYLYTLLFCLSIILINPWGTSRGLIWTQPKILVIMLLCLLNLSILWKERSRLTVSDSWSLSKLLWELFLGIGFLSTLLSPFPLRSFWGQDEMGDGWLYWLALACFSLSNTLLLTLHPKLARSQLNGLLIGGVILAVSIFPQVIDWRIDYTTTMGQLVKPNILASTIFQAHQPIGFYSHRGHAAIVLALVAILALVGWLWRWISIRYFVTALALIIPALLLTQTRAAILALLIGTAYLLGRKYYKLLVPATLVCLLVVGIITTTRHIDNLPLVGVWCYTAYKLTGLPAVADILTRYGNTLVPFVLIGLGIFIVLENHSLNPLALVAASLCLMGLVKKGERSPEEA